MAEATIIFTSALPSPDPARHGQIAMLVSFTVDAGPPDSVVIESANPSDAEITAAISTWVTRKKELAGKKLTI